MTLRTKSFILLASLILFGLTVVTVHAAEPAEDGEAPCRDDARLASIVEAEANGQPWEAREAIAQIVMLEARNRHMSICQLSEDTWFVTVWHYAKAFPRSWHMQRFIHPQEWSLALARDAIAGLLPDEVRRDAMHFDGAPCEHVYWSSGDIFFCE